MRLNRKKRTNKTIGFFLVICSAVLLIESISYGENKYLNKQLHCSMAGSGDPWSALTKKRLALLMAMHDGLDVARLAEYFGMSKGQVEAEIDPLLKSSLVKKEKDRYVPDFFIANLDETKKVYAHARLVGQQIAEVLIGEWTQLEDTYSQLKISKDLSFRKMSFILVGSRILDLNVLQALVRDGTLLTVAPRRPSPTMPEGHYYFWMLECKPEHLGKYGQEDTNLKWTNWHLLNFGQTMLGENVNRQRTEFERKGGELVKSSRLRGPKMLARALGIPFINRSDSRRWEHVSRETSEKIVQILKRKIPDIRAFYQTLKASRHSNNAFGEFFCWYYHLVYVWAIDRLHEAGAIAIPNSRFSALIMHLEGPQGLMSN